MKTYYKHSTVGSNKRRATSSKKRGKIIAALLVVILFGAYVSATLGNDVQVGTVELHQEATASPVELDIDIDWPPRGQSAIGTLEDGVLARSHDNEQQRPIASLAKVITALAVLEKEPLAVGEAGIVITLDTTDEDIYWEYVNKLGSVTAVTAGVEINQYQALQAMLLPSSNNMSDALVRRVFGSVEAYTEYANEMVKRYGLTNTYISDASGFSPQTTSTTSEMIVIAQKALADPVIAQIVAQQEAEIPLSGVVPNYSLIMDDESVNGIKIGNTDEAGWCLLFSTPYVNDSGRRMTLIGVVLGEDSLVNLRESSENLLTNAKSGLSQFEVLGVSALD